MNNIRFILKIILAVLQLKAYVKQHLSGRAEMLHGYEFRLKLGFLIEPRLWLAKCLLKAELEIARLLK